MPNYYESVGVSGSEFSNFGEFDSLDAVINYAQGLEDSGAYDDVAVLEEVKEDGARSWWVLADENELMEREEFEEVEVEENPKVLKPYPVRRKVGQYIALAYSNGVLKAREVGATEHQAARKAYVVAAPNCDSIEVFKMGLSSDHPVDTIGPKRMHELLKVSENPFPFKACIRKARARGIDDPNAYCATVDRRMHHNPLGPSKPVIHGLDVRVNRSKLDQAYEAAVKAGKKLAKEHGQHVRLMDWENGQYVHAGTVRPDGTWDLATSNAYKNPSLRERASHVIGGIKHALTKRSQSKRAVQRLLDMDKPAPVGMVKPTRYGLGQKRNPEGAAEALFESFRGRPSDETLEIHEEFHEHANLTALGYLCSLRVKNAAGKHLINVVSTKSPRQIPNPMDLPLDERVVLCSNEEGNTMYFVGGMQDVDISALGISGEAAKKDLVVLGVLDQVTYLADKPHLGDTEDTAYYHALAEEGGTKPTLLYDPLSCKLSLAGGTYFLSPEGIRD